MKRIALWLFVILMAASLSMFWACGPKDDDDKKDYGGDGLCDACENAAPEEGSLAITIPGEDDVKSQPLATGIGEMAVYYHWTVDISRGLNFYVLGMLGWIDEILSYPVTQNVNGYCVWGPFIYDGLSPVETQFRMRENPNQANSYDYYWEHRPKNTQEEWTVVWGGEITPSTDTARRGIGTLYIDYTAAQALDPTINATGRIDVDYDTYTDGRRIDIAFDDVAFAEGLGSTTYGAPTDAAYHYHNHADNSGEFEFEYLMDFNVSSVDETVVQTTLWEGGTNPGAGGSMAVISGGDLDTEGFLGTESVEKIVGYECWDSLFLRTFWEVTIHETGGGSSVVETEGDEADCIFDRSDYEL